MRPGLLDRSTWSRYLAPPVPGHLSSRFLDLDSRRLDDLAKSLKTHFFARQPAAFFETPEGRRDLDAHLTARLSFDRHLCIPWLDAAHRLDGAEILEIGCGTGATTIALAEQGARVTGVDVDAPAMEVAKRRLDLYGLKADLQVGNATDVARLYGGRSFDFIIYWASLEHMTLAERLSTIEQSWGMLSPGQKWVVIECPNRLHYEDTHTSSLPFFMWLPDDLAMAYARFSPRESYKDACASSSVDTPEGRELLARWGRGMSYHELELATGRRVDELSVVSSLLTFREAGNAAYRARRLMSRDGQWARQLKRMNPSAHVGFFEPYLNMIIEKR